MLELNFNQVSPHELRVTDLKTKEVVFKKKGGQCDGTFKPAVHLPIPNCRFNLSIFWPNKQISVLDANPMRKSKLLRALFSYENDRSHIQAFGLKIHSYKVADLSKPGSKPASTKEQPTDRSPPSKPR